MKSNLWKIVAVLTVFFSLPPSVALPNETLDGFYWNPVLLNGRSVSPAELAAARGGKLSLVKLDPKSSRVTKVPFLIYLKRGGKIVDGNAYAHKNPVLEGDIYEVLKAARSGDQLIIDPVNNENQIGRRVITVQSSQLTPQFRWFGFTKKGDGC
ncbi:hypothetical protein MUK70_17240 [Dyadobacter chenwenxiniae]|uniref:Uncharacterized protein n=1 Tax=Dyadobacter chenwenxiniae TaxID=2906456 RepID=A0A9X1TDR0_9BACT|nr:hypothetical protein [Dyadobacter chenwenxiniae]MCF0060984.1 hypothetical protein [Dyadobacter chenwenxiniae]UON80812.1 hypothetical protein MUK70_17240 [Dyadobacter chenwenxiniae]